MFLKGRKHHKNSFEIFHQETFVQLARQCQSCWSKFKTFVFRICPTSILQNRLSLLRSGINFINVLRTAFALVDPKSVKRYWQLDWILTLLGATGVKAVRKYVGKINPWSGYFGMSKVWSRRLKTQWKKKRNRKGLPVVKCLEISSCVLFEGNETIINFWFN